MEIDIELFGWGCKHYLNYPKLGVLSGPILAFPGRSSSKQDFGVAVRTIHLEEDAAEADHCGFCPLPSRQLQIIHDDWIMQIVQLTRVTGELMKMNT